MEAVRRYDVLDTPPDGAFDRITALAARHFGVPISIVSIVDTDRIWFKSHHGLDVDEIGRDPGLCASAILQDGPWIVEDASSDARTLANPLVAGEFGLRFYAGAPLTTREGHNLGTLCVIDHEPREVSEDDAGVLRDLAAIVVDELELRLSSRTAVEREQELRDLAERTARSLQETLLPPELPAIEGAELAALYQPADDSVVGGDFYDVFAVAPDLWVMAVGDVSGKGASAAGVTGLARHTIRTAAMTTDDPARVLTVLNRAMFLGREGDLDHYCTAHVAFLRREGNGFALRSASAGHPAGVLLRASSDVESVAAEGPPVGWFETAAFTAVDVVLAPGDALVLYTDGLSEARRDGALLGEPAIHALLAEAAGETADGIAGRIAALLARDDTEQRDDTALLVARVR
jgi:sigma-B regulation protein RsbU (phosphoserine phosphatase)